MPLEAPVEGGVELDFYAPWDDPSRDNCAIYIREGAIIPKRELEQYIGELYSQGKTNPITFSIYPGRDSSYKLYLDDDGVTNNAEKAGEYRLTEITHEGKPMRPLLNSTVNINWNKISHWIFDGRIRQLW